MSYPECEKMQSVKDKSQIIGAFLEDCGYTLCEFDKYGQYMPVAGTIEQILAEYFEIDMKKVEEERRQILANL